MDFTCAACRRIPVMDDFRHRVARRGESGDAHHAKTNIRYRASNELAQSQAQELRSLKKQQFFLVSKLAASQASRMSWKARCRNAAGRGDVRRVTDELTKAYEDGKFEGKTALWNFLSDLIHCAASEPDKNGRRATIRYHGSTHRFFCRVAQTWWSQDPEVHHSKLRGARRTNVAALLVCSEAQIHARVQSCRRDSYLSRTCVCREEEGAGHHSSSTV